MARPEIVNYLQTHLAEFPVEELRRQLAAEGVSDADFEAALSAAKAAAGAKHPPRKARLLLVLGVVVVAAAAFFAISRQQLPTEPPAPPPSPTAVAQSAFVSRYGYVIRLPAAYAAVAAYKDEQKKIEIVHFCKVGTDPTNFADEGLYGQLGIVRLEVQPSPFSGSLHGLEALSRTVAARAQQRGEKITVKNLQVSSLRGIQVTYGAPFSRVEAYILGQNVLYTFTAGQEDDIFRTILTSLRDANSEG